VLEAAKQLGARIEAITLTLAHQSGADDRLFGAVTNMELAEQLKAQGVEVDRKRVVLAEPIKQLGEFTAAVKLHPEVTATLKVVVTKA